MRNIELFDYSPIVEREPIQWPHDARVAFYARTTAAVEAHAAR